MNDRLLTSALALSVLITPVVALSQNTPPDQPKIVSYSSMPKKAKRRLAVDVNVKPKGKAPFHITSGGDTNATATTDVKILVYAAGDPNNPNGPSSTQCVAAVQGSRILIPKNAGGWTITWNLQNANSHDTTVYQFEGSAKRDSVDLNSWQKKQYANNPQHDLKDPTLSNSRTAFTWTIVGDRKRGATDACHTKGGDDDPANPGEKCEIAYLVWVVNTTGNQTCLSTDPVIINTGE